MTLNEFVNTYIGVQVGDRAMRGLNKKVRIGCFKFNTSGSRERCRLL